MRTRRVFTPVVDFMPSRISPSAATAAIAHVVSAPSNPPVQTPTGPSGLQMGAMDDTTGSVSYPIIAGEPTPPPTTINC